MEIALTRSLEALLLPPGGPLLLAMLGLLLHWRGWRPARWLTLGGLSLLYLCMLPPLAEVLLRGLEHHPALTPEQARHSGAGAIVVLGAGRYPGAPEYGGDTPSAPALERMRYGARLHRLTGLPLLVSGGSPLGETVPEAALLAQVLRDEYGIDAVYEEGSSRNTVESARLLARRLQLEGINEILLVTHAWHMPRSLLSFAGTGLTVHPAPTAFATTDPNVPWLLRLLPSAVALRDSRLALHEYLGLLWYRLRYQLRDGQGPATSASSG